MSGDGQALRTGTLTRHMRRPRGDAADERQQRRPDDGRRAVWALLASRTVVRGGYVQACPAGPVTRLWAHACRHRLCPPWAWLPGERGRARLRRRLLACEHDPILVTLPHALQARWRAHVAVRTQRWCARVHETVCAL
jgi:hypothetical protein